MKMIWMTREKRFYSQFYLFLKIMRAKSAMVRKNVTVAIETQHQNQKNKMLQEDRKMFLRQAQEIKQKYEEEIERLKNQNRKLKTVRDEFISKRRNKTAFSRTTYTEGVSVNLSTMDENYLRIMLDKEKHQTKIRKNMLFTLQDKLKQVQDNKLGYIEQNPMMRTIRLLENRLDKVMIKYNQAQSIQQTYQQVVKRLREERVGYDSQLASIQTCLRGKQHDFEQLLLLAHDAAHAKQAAFAELKRFQQRRITVHEMRNKYINQKKEDINKEIPNQTTDNPSKIQRGTLNNRPANFYPSSYKHDENYQRQELSDYQQAFRKLKQVTGVVDANEIIQKFKTQGLTTQSLEQLQANYTTKTDNLKREKQNLRKRLDTSKYIKDRQGNQRRRLDQIESDLAKTTNQYQRTSLKYNKLSNELINIKAGIQHLNDLLSFYKIQNQVKGQGIQIQLQNIFSKLRMIYDVVRTDPNYMKNSFKSSVSAIQAIIKEQAGFKNYRKEDQDDNQDD